MKPIGYNITPDVRGEYIHIKHGTRYMVVSLGKVKFNGEWYHSVNYEPVTNPGEIYTRRLKDFQENFADADGLTEV